MTVSTAPTYQQRTSAAITWLRFPLIFLVILLHAYSVVQLPGSHAAYFKTVYPFALWLGETGVPGFLFISGYLFFLSHKTYGEKLKGRFHSLLVPYLLWNGLLLLGYLAAYAAGHPQDINGRSMVDYGWADYVRLFWDRGSFDNGNFVPLLCPYWYIRNLLLLSLLSPIIYILVQRLGAIFFLLPVAIWWMLTPHNAFIPQSVLFFSLGAFFSIRSKVPLQLFHDWRKPLLALFLLFALADVLSHILVPTPVNLQLHRLALLFNLPALFLLADWLSQRGCQSALLTNAAFIVFSIHYPLMVVLRKACTHYLGDACDGVQLLLYVGCVVAATLLSLLFYLVLPVWARNLLSGNRS